MRTKFPVAAIVFAIGIATTACGGTTDDAPTTTTESPAGQFESADGVMTDVSDTSRLVILNGDLTEIAFALGAADSVVGIDLTTTYPEEAAQLPDVGIARNVSAEKVIELAPTLVIADTQLGPQTAIDQIRAAGIPIALLRLESTLPGVTRKIATVASILGLESEGQTLTRQVQSEIDAALDVAARADATPTVGYVYARGPETLLMFGTGMPTHFLIQAAGGVDVFGANGVVFAQDLSAETLVTAAPDVLITSEEGFEILGGMDSFLALPGVADTPAGQSQSILRYDEAKFLGMGPRVGEALMELVLDLHPELAAP